MFKYSQNLSYFCPKLFFSRRPSFFLFLASIKLGVKWLSGKEHFRNQQV